MEQQQQFRGDGAWQPLIHEHLSDLIGLIYDCTLDPALWPEAIRAVGDTTSCSAGMLVVTDLERSQAGYLCRNCFDGCGINSSLAAFKGGKAHSMISSRSCW